MKRLVWITLAATTLFAQCPPEAVPGTCIENSDIAMISELSEVTVAPDTVAPEIQQNVQENDFDKVYEGIVALQNEDYETAFSIFYGLAAAGNFLAQQNLGVMYNHGLGIREDKEKAAYWFEKANKNRQDSGWMKICRTETDYSSR